MDYDPSTVDWDAMEERALEADLEVSQRAARPERIRWVKVLPGEAIYGIIWSRIKDAWLQQARKLGVNKSQPSVIRIAVDEEGEPLTTHDETVHGNGRLADGTPLGSARARSRAERNLAHLMRFVEQAPKLSQERRDRMNPPWNWTKGRPARQDDRSCDTIFRIGRGDETRFPPVPFSEVIFDAWWPSRRTSRQRGAKQAPTVGDADRPI